MRYGNYSLCLMCMFLTFSNESRGTIQKLIYIGFCSPILLCMVVGSNYKIGQIDAENDLYFMIYFCASQVWITWIFYNLWMFNEQNSIIEFKTKVEMQDLLKVIVNNLKECIVIISNQQIEYTNDLFVRNYDK